tara:strand:+ start:838 stop:1098 length:261 start_codon:yes stop_codon:yes gene_type:complete
MKYLYYEAQFELDEVGNPVREHLDHSSFQVGSWEKITQYAKSRYAWYSDNHTIHTGGQDEEGPEWGFLIICEEGNTLSRVVCVKEL